MDGYNDSFTNAQLAFALFYASEELAKALHRIGDFRSYEAMRRALLSVALSGFSDLIEERHWDYLNFASDVWAADGVKPWVH